MAIAETPSISRSIALDQISVPDNVRDLDPEHVDALAGSIALQGLIVPVIVRPDGDRFVLVAGFHRYAAHRQLGLSEIACEVRDGKSEDADRAVENITSCRRRHETIYADRVAMPISVEMQRVSGLLAKRRWHDLRGREGGSCTCEMDSTRRDKL